MHLAYFRITGGEGWDLTNVAQVISSGVFPSKLLLHGGEGWILASNLPLGHALKLSYLSKMSAKYTQLSGTYSAQLFSEGGALVTANQTLKISRSAPSVAPLSR